MANVQVRQAVLADLETLVPLFDAYRQFYGRESEPSLAREFLRTRFNHGESVVFLASNATGEGLGFTQLYPSFSSISACRTFILNDLYVLPELRRHGVGGALLEAAAAYARQVRAVRVTLSTLHENTAAQSLYQRHGWILDEHFRVYHRAIFAEDA